jgi:hypothetical protein
MKSLFAAPLLLFQLQPLVGSAACALFSDRPAEQTCEMPEQRPATHASVLQGGSASQGCALASVCATSPLAIASLPESLESAVAFYSQSPLTTAPALFGIPSAPPFHPPRA